MTTVIPLILAAEATQQAPNPILPATNELVFGGLAFLLLLLVMKVYAFPAVQKTMDARSSRIREALNDADRTKIEAESVLSEYKQQLGDAKNESNRIIEEARQIAEQLRKDMLARAEADVAQLRQRSQQEIQAAQQRAIVEVRQQVAGMAIDLAEKVVERNLDRDTNLALVDNYIRRLESQSK